MSFASSLTLKNAAKASVTYVGIGSPDKGAAGWINSATDLSAPDMLNIKHALAPPGLSGVDRHLFQLVLTKNDAAGKPASLTGNFSIIKPRSALFTATDVNDVVMKMVSLLITDVTSVTLSAAVITSFMNGETR